MAAEMNCGNISHTLVTCRELWLRPEGLHGAMFEVEQLNLTFLSFQPKLVGGYIVHKGKIINRTAKESVC